MEFHKKKILGLSVGISLVRAALLPVSAFAADKGMVPALSWSFCHRTNGASPVQFQEFKANQHNILKAIMQFKAGERPAKVINRITKGYSDEEIKLLSAYLGNKPASK